MRATEPAKSATAFRTISEVSGELELPQHVLRFWETKFPQIRPLKRGGGRRYYRPEDVALLRRIQRLLYSEGYTIRGVQRLLRESRRTGVQPPAESGAPDPSPFLHEAPIEAPHEPVPPSVEAEAEGDEGPPAGDEEGEPADAPLHLSDDVRRELEAVLSELRAMRALLGRNHD